MEMEILETADYLKILQNELALAQGCTEPVAAALAVARARELLGMPPEAVELAVSTNIFKNAMGVGIPGTREHGLPMAAALGAVYGNSKDGLRVLAGIDAETESKAKQFLENHPPKITLESPSPDRLYIRAVCKNGNREASAVIAGRHDRFVSEQADGRELAVPGRQADRAEDIPLSLAGIYDFICKVPWESLGFLEQGLKINRDMAKEGFTGHYGLAVGAGLSDTEAQGDRQQELWKNAVAYAAAACDARMDGCPLPVMSLAGSGNMGLTAGLSVDIMARNRGESDETRLRAVALSQLVSIHIKRQLGKLSALCGCAVASSIGASCALVYLWGGGLEEMQNAIRLMIADISGLICDGAKPGCALKIATSLQAAYQCAVLAIRRRSPTQRDGIVATEAEDSIAHLAQLGNIGMKATDETLLQIMLCNQQ